MQKKKSTVEEKQTQKQKGRERIGKRREVKQKRKMKRREGEGSVSLCFLYLFGKSVSVESAMKCTERKFQLYHMLEYSPGIRNRYRYAEEDE